MGNQPLTSEQTGRPRCWPTTRQSLALTHWVALTVVIMTVLWAGIAVAPSALADPVDNLRAAVAASRDASSCAPFRSDPIVEQVAEAINNSTNDWLDHTASHVPITDPLPGLKELGYRGNKGTTFGGASAASQADAIKGVLLEGYVRIPDCSYTDFGVSMLRNEGSGFYLAQVVLAGP